MNSSKETRQRGQALSARSLLATNRNYCSIFLLDSLYRYVGSSPSSPLRYPFFLLNHEQCPLYCYMSLARRQRPPVSASAGCQQRLRIIQKLLTTIYIIHLASVHLMTSHNELLSNFRRTGLSAYYLLPAVHISCPTMEKNPSRDGGGQLLETSQFLY